MAPGEPEAKVSNAAPSHFRPGKVDSVLSVGNWVGFGVSVG